MFDALDYEIMRQLCRRGRTSWSELATILGLSAPSAADRVKRLEEKGIIRGYAARLDYQALLHVTAFVAVSLSHPKHRSGFIKAVEGAQEVEECHHVAGDDDYLLKVRCWTIGHLDRFLNDHLKRIPGIARTRTTIALSSPKESPVIPEKVDD